MPSVKSLRLFSRLKVETFCAEHGPVALIQQPQSALYMRVARQMGRGQTVVVSSPSRVAEQLQSMLRDLGDLEVIFIRPKKEAEVFSLGRLDSCSLVVADPSVSKLHAILRWSAAERGCYVRDMGSTNGTFINAVSLGDQEQSLRDGDAVAFGDMQFLFLHSETLHAHLMKLGPVAR